MRKLLWIWILSLVLPGFAAAQDLEERVNALEERQKELEFQLLEAEKGEDSSTLRAFWKKGLNFETADKQFKMKIGGRIQNDWLWASEEKELEHFSGIGDIHDGTEFRRARLYASGTLYSNMDFKLQFDFAGGDADLKDAYLALKELSFGKLKIGHYKEPFSLDMLTSSKYMTFMERSLPSIFAPSRNTGFAVYNNACEERLTWALGFFRDADDYGEGQADGGYGATARLTGLPLYEDKGRRLLHLGSSFSFRCPEDTFRFRQRPEMHLAPRFVDTGEVPVDDLLFWGAEFALVYESFSLQGEYMIARAIGAKTGSPVKKHDLTFNGYYVQASYFLTGENRAYKKSNAAFQQIKQKSNFLQDGGWGAWQVGARYSAIDLKEGDIKGGKLSDITLALSWYLNPHVRFSMNYVRAALDDRGDVDGDANLFGLRFQVEF